MDPQRKSPWAMWVGIAGAGLIAYALASGPFVWLLDTGRIPASATIVYAPLSYAAGVMPESIQRVYRRYLEWWSPPAVIFDSIIDLPTDAL